MIRRVNDGVRVLFVLFLFLQAGLVLYESAYVLQPCTLPT